MFEHLIHKNDLFLSQETAMQQNHQYHPHDSTGRFSYERNRLLSFSIISGRSDPKWTEKITSAQQMTSFENT